MASQTGASRMEDSKIGPGILIRTLEKGDESQNLKKGNTVLVRELGHDSMMSDEIAFWNLILRRKHNVSTLGSLWRLLRKRDKGRVVQRPESATVAKAGTRACHGRLGSGPCQYAFGSGGRSYHSPSLCLWRAGVSPQNSSSIDSHVSNGNTENRIKLIKGLQIQFSGMQSSRLRLLLVQPACCVQLVPTTAIRLRWTQFSKINSMHSFFKPGQKT